nr:HP1 family phage holin [Vibrio atlanticus]
MVSISHVKKPRLTSEVFSFLPFITPFHCESRVLFYGSNMQDKPSSFSSYLTSGLLALTGAFSVQDWAAVIGVVMMFVTYFTNRGITLKR